MLFRGFSYRTFLIILGGMSVATKHKSSLGAKLRIARDEAGLTQVELAKKLKKNQSEISAWETGDHEPQLSTLKAIANALKVPLSELLDAA